MENGTGSTKSAENPVNDAIQTALQTLTAAGIRVEIAQLWPFEHTCLVLKDVNWNSGQPIIKREKRSIFGGDVL